MGLGVCVLNTKVVAANSENLHEWLENLPEIVREKEPANVLALVFFVEMLKKENARGSNA